MRELTPYYHGYLLYRHQNVRLYKDWLDRFGKVVPEEIKHHPNFKKLFPTRLRESGFGIPVKIADIPHSFHAKALGVFKDPDGIFNNHWHIRVTDSDQFPARRIDIIVGPMDVLIG